VVERDDHPPVATFFADSHLDRDVVTLGEAVAHHARVKRLGVGNVVLITDGVGRCATGAITAVRRGALDIAIGRVEVRPQPAPIHLRVPIGDRDRMLWLAEKATELGVATWQGVRFRRSASVSPRGEGEAFRAKLRARMIGAVEQSGGAWLPAILPDAELETVAVDPAATRIVLDGSGPPILRVVALATPAEPVILFGPEGGIESEERARLQRSGWQAASLATTTLRFETAGIAAVAVVRAARLAAAP
jgi:16S rRNA (uracil1498-N3)-methyltransferase